MFPKHVEMTLLDSRAGHFISLKTQITNTITRQKSVPRTPLQFDQLLTLVNCQQWGFF